MTENEFVIYSNDIQMAEKMYRQVNTDGNLSYVQQIFRTIYKRKFNADMYDKPYVSVFA